MIREAFGTAKTVDQAIDAACLQLGVDREKVEFEIIDLPKRGFFIRKDAKVRVFMDVPEPKTTPAPRRTEQPKQYIQPESQPQTNKAEVKTENRQKAQENAPHKAEPRNEFRPRQAAQKPQQPKPQPQPQNKVQAEPVQITPTPEVTAKAELAVDYVLSILNSMGLEGATVKPVYTQNGVSLALAGEGLGVIIGRRGETLDSLQYLAGLVANRLGGDYVRITIDSGNYRQKRETTLEGLARKLANQVVRSGKPCTLEPMNPYERRIIHAAVSQIKGATSSSVGEEPNRRVVISSTGERPASSDDRTNGHGGNRYPNKNNGAKNGGDNRSNRGGYRDYRDDRPARSHSNNNRNTQPRQAEEAKVEEPKHTQVQAPVQAPAQQPKPTKERSLHDAELGGKLYGKIEL